jgi:hypothetical protein
VDATSASCSTIRAREVAIPVRPVHSRPARRGRGPAIVRSTPASTRPKLEGGRKNVGAANKKFLEEKERFLRENVAVLKTPQQHMAAQGMALTGVHEFDLVEVPNFNYFDTAGRKVKTYAQAPVTPGGNGLLEVARSYDRADGQRRKRRSGTIEPTVTTAAIANRVR